MGEDISLFMKKKYSFIVIILFYIVGQLVGSHMIKKIFIQYEMDQMLPELQRIEQEVSEGKKQITINTNFIVKVFDTNGKEVPIISLENGKYLKENYILQFLEKYRIDLIQTKMIQEVVVLEKQPVKSFLVGKRWEKGGIVFGTIFLLKPFDEFSLLMTSFHIIYGITLLIGTLFFLIFTRSYLKEERRLERLRREYLANVSHELKSPLVSIKALTETLVDGMIKEEDIKNKYYHIILKETDNLHKLIEDMLTLSKLQNSSCLDKEQVDIKEITCYLKEKYSTLLEKQGIYFLIDDSFYKISNMNTNRERLIQLFNILIGNAIKFSKENGTIVIRAKEVKNKFEIYVEDNGLGIQKTDLPYIFERFYKGKKENKEGSGLGLAIAKSIIEQMGEKIYVYSEEGKGTKFVFTIKK